jgi:hypothetical protein
MCIVFEIENGLLKIDRWRTQYAKEDGPAQSVIIRDGALKEGNQGITNSHSMSRHGPLCGNSMVSVVS